MTSTFSFLYKDFERVANVSLNALANVRLSLCLMSFHVLCMCVYCIDVNVCVRVGQEYKGK